ncbi:uncharacterized protein LOC111101617 [Crassostrea virginica]|uniref:Uncharacterized protein LOC111101617 n=1 Tax=Crassostrea virginica TaxID=6565 RepID=A0A8B8AFC7_CRAVI|nr:uncharacterized protein LOC111101617 [Crassostrea virginica]XP_022294315.1 uncharacterized protein LOC111104588 [Crassostrea virginica]
MISRRLASFSASLARCSRRNIHTSAARTGAHPRGIPIEGRVYKTTLGRPPPDNFLWMWATALMFLGFTRISYFMIAHFDHWTGGHFKIPNAYAWTDEELGIPPDEEGLLKPEESS